MSRSAVCVCGGLGCSMGKLWVVSMVLHVPKKGVIDDSLGGEGRGWGC